MNSIECCQLVLKEKSAKLLRIRKDSKPIQYDVKEPFIGNNKKWFLLDLFSASAVITIYDNVLPATQEKMKTVQIEKLCNLAFKYVR